MNKFLAQDTKALTQAMYTFGDWYTVIRTKVSQYNDSGRYDPIEVKEQIFCSIQENRKDIKVSGNGNGEGAREDVSYTLTIVKPQYVNTGDIIITKEFGRLKVMDKSGYTEIDGTTSYTLVRTGNADKQKNDIDYVY